jgi:peptidylprolyl isomerase
MPAVSRGAISILAACAALTLAVAGCGGGDDTSSSTGSSESGGAAKPATGSTDLTKKPTVTVPAGAPPKKLEETEIVEGDGPEAKPGDEVTVQYVGVGYKSQEQFDASWDRGEPFSFTLGAGEVIPGWDEGVKGMKVGGRRELTIPAELAYGPSGSPPVIGPNETLIFIIDLLAVN